MRFPKQQPRAGPRPHQTKLENTLGVYLNNFHNLDITAETCLPNLRSSSPLEAFFVLLWL